jgi:hypothetical protein
MKVKQHTINLLAELSITSSYFSINSKSAELTKIKKVSCSLYIYSLKLSEIYKQQLTYIETNFQSSASLL